MARNVFGILLALVGAAAAAWSPFATWYGGRLGRDFKVDELFTSTGITGTQAALWTGLFAPMLGVAVLTLLAALLRSRLLVALAGLVVLGFTILWMVRQGQEAGTLTAGAGGLGEGVGYAIGGGALLLVGALVMRGRRRGRRRKGRGGPGRVDDGHAAPPAQEDQEFSEMPQPYGPFGTTHGPHGAYRADEDWGPYGRGHDPYDDDATPSEEWDPWAAGRPEPRPPIVQPLPGAPGGPGGPERPGDREGHGDEDQRDESGGQPPDQPPDQPPQGPQKQPPPPSPGPGGGTGGTAGTDGTGDGDRGPHDTQRIPRRPGRYRGGPYQ
ncbi:hypothetical protein [Streptomyces winkii]|uniref:hypothetical protein n=1 Tax=Streptomyces winkii TaxID=3051178 RepID=UPI0028D7E2EF|nr:hypothetical protein [Streptomyces sp. DSM 40971]